jgi:hypothetical protein
MLARQFRLSLHLGSMSLNTSPTMLKTPFLEFLRENARLEGNFRVGLPETYNEVFDEPAPLLPVDARCQMVRVHILKNVVLPLIVGARSVNFYNTEFSPTSFSGEGSRLHEILKKIGPKSYELSSRDDPTVYFENFWQGIESDGSARGYVVFLMGEDFFAFKKLFSFCYEPNVVALSSLRATLGVTLCKRINENVIANPMDTSIVLGFKGNLGNLTIFPGASVFDARLEQAISSTRDYDVERVGN